MPHLRNRYLLEEITRDLKWSKVVSILGMRQVGKTTLVRGLAQSYFSFDEGVIRNRGLQEDWSFLEGASKPIALDECQVVPGSFSQVKYRVDQSSQPGQFLMTGSVRFLSKKDIRESLTGRTSILELLPMNLSEVEQKPLSRFFTLISTAGSPEAIFSKLEKHTRFQLKDIQRHAQLGGLPGVSFRRDEQVRERIWETHLETILSRDIEMIAPSRLGYIKLRQLLAELLAQSGLPVNKALLAKKVGTSGPTISRFLDAYEALFLVRKHGSTYYPCDLGLNGYLASSMNISERLTWIRIVYNELRTQLEYQYRAVYKLSEVKTRGGMDIPFLVEIKKLGKFAFTVDAEDRVTDKSLKSLTWYQKRSEDARTIALHLGNQAYLSSAGHYCLPLRWLF